MHSEHSTLSALDARIRALVLGDSRDLDGVVRDLFTHQYAHCEVYRRLCDARGVSAVSGWQDVPAIPVDAFKSADVRCFPAHKTQVVFHTSGTTTGEHGRHAFDDLDLYRLASMRSFAKALVPSGERVRIISLIPTIDSLPDSSLSQMVSWAIEHYGTADSTVDPSGEALCGLSGAPLILGTAIALARVLERRPQLKLPAGTCLMETGGFKGRRTQLQREDMFGLYRAAGLDSACVVGEYGMTELSSQWYDAVAGAGGRDPRERVYRPAPWARTRVVDPNTLQDVDYGKTGLLLHIDPVNRGSVQAVLTSDLGERCPSHDGPDGFRYLGRAAGAALRGCSLRSAG